MEAVRLIQKPENGRLIIEVPETMRDEALIIEFRPVREQQSGHPNPGLAEASKAFFDKLSRVKTDFDDKDFNVYEQ